MGCSLFPWTVKTHKYGLWTLENHISVILFDLKLIQRRIYKLEDLSGELKETNETNHYADQQNQRVDIRVAHAVTVISHVTYCIISLIEF